MGGEEVYMPHLTSLQERKIKMYNKKGQIQHDIFYLSCWMLMDRLGTTQLLQKKYMNWIYTKWRTVVLWGLFRNYLNLLLYTDQLFAWGLYVLQQTLWLIFVASQLLLLSPSPQSPEAAFRSEGHKIFPRWYSTSGRLGLNQLDPLVRPY